MTALIYLSIALMALLGAPIFSIFGMLALVSFTLEGIDVSAVVVEMMRLASNPSLVAVPVFCFAGYLLAESKTPDRLLRFAEAGFGWLPGGVAVVSLLVCSVFTAFTGGSGVTIVALGGLMLPILKKNGFSENFALGLITASGSLGILFPPSLPIILYGMVGKVDINNLFLAGIVPCLVLIFILAVYVLWEGRRTISRSQFSWSEFAKALWGARFELPIPIFVLVGIYGGITTPSEAAVVIALYTILMICVFYKDMDFFRDVPKVVNDCMTLVGAILLKLCCALGFVNYVIDADIPGKILALMQTYIASQVTFLLCLNLFLLFVGMMIDIFTAIIVIVPIITPIAMQYGINPIHLAVIFLTNLEIGYLAPPVGLNLFIASQRFNKPVFDICKASLPFLLLMLIGLLVVTYIPYITLFWFK